MLLKNGVVDSILLFFIILYIFDVLSLPARWKIEFAIICLMFRYMPSSAWYQSYFRSSTKPLILRMRSFTLAWHRKNHMMLIVRDVPLWLVADTRHFAHCMSFTEQPVHERDKTHHVSSFHAVNLQSDWCWVIEQDELKMTGKLLSSLFPCCMKVGKVFLLWILYGTVRYGIFSAVCILCSIFRHTSVVVRLHSFTKNTSS